jgi:hypothetical protein
MRALFLSSAIIYVVILKVFASVASLVSKKGTIRGNNKREQQKGTASA